MCNHEGCSYAALEETEGWKASHSVSRCPVCYGKTETGSVDCAIPERSSQIKSDGAKYCQDPIKAQKKRKSIKQDGNRGVKRKFLTLKRKK